MTTPTHTHEDDDVRVTNLAELYEVPAMDWAAVRRGLDRGIPQAPGSGGPDRHTAWLSTIDADGSPHVTALGLLWVEGSFWFETGSRTRKARNLARDPRCTASLATAEFDLVVEGVALLVTDPDVVADKARRWAQEGWPCEVDSSGVRLTAPFSAPSAGPPPWSVYRLRIDRATAVATVEPGGATTWAFGRQDPGC